MITQLVILGLIKNRFLYGYQINQIIREELGEGFNIAFGSIYFALGRLAAKGFIKKAGEHKEGGRPSRIIYTITDLGKLKFRSMLREVLEIWENIRFPFDAGLYFMNSLESDDLKVLIGRRISRIENALSEAKEKFSEIDPNTEISDINEIIIDHSIIHLETELAWIKELAIKIEKKQLQKEV